MLDVVLRCKGVERCDVVFEWFYNDVRYEQLMAAKFNEILSG
jgi:hypothetical protein